MKYVCTSYNMFSAVDWRREMVFAELLLLLSMSSRVRNDPDARGDRAAAAASQPQNHVAHRIHPKPDADAPFINTQTAHSTIKDARG